MARTLRMFWDIPYIYKSVLRKKEAYKSYESYGFPKKTLIWWDKSYVRRGGAIYYRQDREGNVRRQELSAEFSVFSLKKD